MGWISLEAAANNVITTLKGLAGKIPGFKIATNPHGMFPTFFDIRTGGYLGPGTSYSPMSTALMMAGVQFAVTFFEKNAALLPGPPGTVALISSLFSELWHSIDFESLPCSRAGLVDKVAGTGVPMLQDANASLCSATQYPQLDGLYEYDEEHYAVWYAYQSACSGYAAGGCPNKAIETMWSKWQGRRNKPNHAYGGHPLMTMWSGYVLQLPYYTTHPFNSDPVYTALFRESWSADWQYYNNTRHAGERGRYGLGAGPTPAWCSGGATYVADQIGQGSSYCRVYSPYILAGYLPAAPNVIASQLVDLLADGESVLQVPGTPYHVLWRKAMLDRSWTSPWITMVDFSSLLFGLSTLWVEDGFFQNFTDHAPPRPAKRSEAHLRG